MPLRHLGLSLWLWGSHLRSLTLDVLTSKIGIKGRLQVTLDHGCQTPAIGGHSVNVVPAMPTLHPASPSESFSSSECKLSISPTWNVRATLNYSAFMSLSSLVQLPV